MRALILGLLVLITSYDASASEAVPPDVKKVVTFIFGSDSQGTISVDQKTNEPQPNGTGFFVSVPTDLRPSDGRSYCYLVTAKHVLRSADGAFFKRIYLRLNLVKGDTDYLAVDLTGGNSLNIYMHPDPTVDIAVIPVVPDPFRYEYKTIPSEMLSGKTLDAGIAEGSDVFFTGLFVYYIGDHHNNPIVRFGRVALLPEDRISWQEVGKEKSLTFSIF